ncbi:MAG: GYD domain-containing protein [Dehalococcoidia bacterium]|nr:GYD domain-containing protein [Dehalococcoidia bacterium]
MAIYILLSTLTDEGAKTLKARPARILEVNSEIEAMGAKVVEQYAVLGLYDFVNIVEAPDNETIARVSLELSSRGTVHIITLPALPLSELLGTRPSSGGQPTAARPAMPRRAPARTRSA